LLLGGVGFLFRETEEGRRRFRVSAAEREDAD
jgi:hypothetical protein